MRSGALDDARAPDAAAEAPPAPDDHRPATLPSPAQGEVHPEAPTSDGAATDGDVSEAMKPLQNLPVWVVVRLCTDDDSVVQYWNRPCLRLHHANAPHD